MDALKTRERDQGNVIYPAFGAISQKAAADVEGGRSERSSSKDRSHAKRSGKDRKRSRKKEAIHPVTQWSVNLILVVVLFLVGVFTYRVTSTWFVGQPVKLSKIVQLNYNPLPDVAKVKAKKKTSVVKKNKKRKG